MGILTKEKQRGLKATESERNLELRWLTAQEHKMLRRTSGKGSSLITPEAIDGSLRERNAGTARSSKHRLVIQTQDHVASLLLLPNV